MINISLWLNPMTHTYFALSADIGMAMESNNVGELLQAVKEFMVHEIPHKEWDKKLTNYE